MSRERRPKRPSKPINPIILIVLGLLISLYSLIIIWTVPSSNKSSMGVFAIIGGLFLLVGVIRVLMSRNKKQSSIEKQEEELASTFTGENNKQNNKPIKKIITCHNCNSRNYSTSNFCHMCGARLK